MLLLSLVVSNSKLPNVWMTRSDSQSKPKDSFYVFGILEGNCTFGYLKQFIQRPRDFKMKASFTGYPGSLSPEQQKTFDLFKSHVTKSTQNPIYDDHYLCRFCRARDFDLTKVIKMWDEFLKWRKDNDIDNIHVQATPHSIQHFSFLPCFGLYY